VGQGTPTTTNALESKTGIFKPFSRIAKFFPVPKLCEEFYSAVALMANFDLKTRGLNGGTHAMQRAGIATWGLRRLRLFLNGGVAETANVSGVYHGLMNHPAKVDLWVIAGG